MKIKALHSQGILSLTGSNETVGSLNVNLKPNQTKTIDDRFRSLSSIENAVLRGQLEILSFDNSDASFVMQQELNKKIGNVPNKDATNMDNWKKNGATEGQTIAWDGSKWTPTDSNRRIVVTRELDKDEPSGTANSGSARTYPVNAIPIDQITGGTASIDGFDITDIPAGTYLVKISLRCHNTRRFAAWLQDIGSSTDLGKLATGFADDNSNTESTVNSIFQFTHSGNKLRLLYECEVTKNNDGLGLPPVEVGINGNVPSIKWVAGYVEFVKV